MLPKLPGLKAAAFCKRITLFSEMFVAFDETNKKDEANCVIWRGSIKGRSTIDVPSTYAKLYQSEAVEIKDFQVAIRKILTKMPSPTTKSKKLNRHALFLKERHDKNQTIMKKCFA